MLGHETIGNGKTGVIITNDWLSDVSSWESAQPYLNQELFTWALADLRGYGRSKFLNGKYQIDEAVGDILELANHLGWEHFCLVGHSMSTLIALHLAQHHAERLRALVLIAPPPPQGFGASDDIVAALQGLATAPAEGKAQGLAQQWGGRLCSTWVQRKARHWSEGATPEAAAGYVPLFAQLGLPNGDRVVETPTLAICGEQDSAEMRSSAVEASLGPICRDVRVQAIASSGHYPMQETPPLLATHIEQFLAAHT